MPIKIDTQKKVNSDNTAGAEDNRFVNTRDREDMHTGWVWYNCTYN